MLPENIISQQVIGMAMDIHSQLGPGLLESAYRIDRLVEDKVVIELKTVDSLEDIHFAQVLTYLKLGNYKLGLLINFNVPSLKNGIRRVVNGL